MTNRINCLDIQTPTASPKPRSMKDTAQACRDRASADLVKSLAMLTANQRQALERSAENWASRALLLERVEQSFEKRRALDEASQQYRFDHGRL